MSWIDATRTRLRLIFRRNEAEARMKREMDFHITMETDRLVREEQLPRDEARRRALVAFGGVEKHKEELRSTRGLAWMSGLSLDLKIGFRMLAKYPGLTIVGCLAIATAITVCASYVELLNDAIYPSLPGDFDQRIVRIRNWDVSKHNLDQHPIADYAAWQTQAKTIEGLGAFSFFESNLVTSDGVATPSRVVAISASAFRLLPTRPLLGRTLSDEDERSTSTDVVVVGERIWRSRLHADSAAIGKSIRLGTKTYLVVGVMPGSFGFPVNYSLWIPLKGEALTAVRGTGPMIGVFGRLREGISLERAQAELTAIGQRYALQFPATNANLTPRVKPFLDELMAGPDEQIVSVMLYSINLFLILFLCVCAANVATLVFARTATRESEIAVRTSLGASRGRIVAQLFCESFALTMLSGALGLTATAILLRNIPVKIQQAGLEQPPFWWSDDISMRTVIYTFALTVVAAVVVGVVPALKATSRDVGARLKRSSAGNSNMRFGKLWTGVIVSQIALTVLFLMAVTSIGLNVKVGRYIGSTFNFATDHLLTYSAQMDGGPRAVDSEIYSTAAIDNAGRDRKFPERYQQSATLLNDRVLLQPNVRSATYTSRLPNDDQIITHIEVDGISRFANGDTGRVRVEYASVGPTFFATLGVPAKGGRLFVDADTIAGRNTAIVDQRFVQRVLGGRNPIGARYRRVRFSRDDKKIEFAEWREIVGVVNELSPITYESDKNGIVYEARPLAETYPAFVIVHVQDDPHRHIPEVRKIAAGVDPALVLNDVTTFDESGSEVRLLFWSILKLLGAICAIALMLSTAGVHALMAFTVARRTKEIRIRTALGARRIDVVRDTFARAFAQVGVGIVAGLVPGTLFLVIGPPEIAAGMGLVSGTIAAGTIVVFVLVVASIACALPVWRALRIEPTEALRSEG